MNIIDRRILTLGAAIVTLLSLPLSAWAQQQVPSDYYRPHMWNDGWFGWFAGPIMMVVFIGVVIVVIVLLVRWLGGSAPGHAPHHPIGKTPLDILKGRFARGEIDQQEFEDRKRVLED